jgi:hypothetical protein
MITGVAIQTSNYDWDNVEKQEILECFEKKLVEVSVNNLRKRENTEHFPVPAVLLLVCVFFY